MKKFTFSLAKLKYYKEQMLEAEKNNLGILRRELLTLQSELEQIYNEINEKNDEFAQIMTKGTTPLEISTHKRYITVRKHDASRKQIEIAHKDQEVQKQLEIVLELQKEVSSLEKLEEVQLEEYRLAEMKENELFIDEFINNADFRRQKS